MNEQTVKKTAGVLARHSSRRGAFSAGLTALAVAAVVVFNLLAAQLPASKAQLDLTDTKIYQITPASADYLAAMTDDVALHVLSGEAAVDSRIVRFLEKYVSLGDRLSLEYIDPVVYPSALNTYGAEANTIVVTCAATGRQEVVDIADIIGYDEMMYYMYQQMVETDFDAEGLLTSAVDSVLTDAAHRVYQTSGHEETALPASVTELLQKSHLSVDQVNLLTGGGVPEDCELLILNAPSRDLADDELAMLRDYLSAGGQVLCNLAAQADRLPNLDALCADYGLTVVPGMLADTQRYYQNNPYLFFPQLDASVDAAGSLGGDSTLLFYAARGMTLSDPVRDAISVSPLLTTSDGGVAVVDEATQTAGSFLVGAVAAEDIDGGSTARLTVFGSDSLVSQDLTASFPNIDNLTLFVNAATAGFDDVASVSVAPVSLQEDTNTVATGGIWALLFIFVIPAALLLAGFVRWMRRRKL